jgi:hypothetical protein
MERSYLRVCLLAVNLDESPAVQYPRCGIHSPLQTGVSHANAFSSKNHALHKVLDFRACHAVGPIKDARRQQNGAHPRLVNFGCSVEQKSASLCAAAHFSLCEATNGRRRVSSFMAVFFPPALGSQQPGPGLFSPAVCVTLRVFTHYSVHRMCDSCM